MKGIISMVFIIALLSGCATQNDGESAKAQPPAESTPKIVTSEFDYSVDGTVMKGYIAYDENQTDTRPGVLVVHEWWGQNDYVRKRARMLAELGYTAMAVDMYGDGKLAEHPDDANKFMMAVFQNISGAESRFKAAMESLKNHPSTDPEKIAAIGYCFGGAVVLHMARLGTDLDGVVSFHGNLSSMHTPDSGSVTARILVNHGAADPLVPEEQITAFKKEMDAAGANYEFIAYENALHSFTNPGATAAAEKFGMPVGYNAAADSASWAAMQDMFKEIF